MLSFCGFPSPPTVRQFQRHRRRAAGGGRLTNFARSVFALSRNTVSTTIRFSTDIPPPPRIQKSNFLIRGIRFFILFFFHFVWIQRSDGRAKRSNLCENSVRFTRSSNISYDIGYPRSQIYRTTTYPFRTMRSTPPFFS